MPLWQIPRPWRPAEPAVSAKKKSKWKNPFLYRDAKPCFFPLTPKNLGKLTWNLKLIQLKSKLTLPETNVAPENRPSQKESSIPTIHFQVQTVSFREGIYVNLQGSRPPFGQPLEPSIHLKEIRQHKPFLNVNTFEQREPNPYDIPAWILVG